MKSFTASFTGLVMFFVFANALIVKSDVRSSALFADHMVLQRDVVIPFWGTADPGEKIKLCFRGKTYRTVADAQGKFFISMKQGKAGGPYKMKISGKNKLLINDIYVGEVWLASGQSNMDMTVAKEDRYWCGVHNEAAEVAAATYPQIRIFDVDFKTNNNIQPNAVGVWEVCSPQTVGHFSALAYFFAKDIHTLYKVPVGIITSAYGASTAETWMSKEALETRPALKTVLDNYNAKLQKFVSDSATTMPEYRAGMEKYKENVAAAKASAGDVNASPRIRAPRDPNPEHDQHNPYVCYNGMIAPLIPYAIKGALWYQGESNGPNAAQYREIMETLVADWRTRWGLGDFPFLYVQLANNGKPMEKPVEHNSMMVVREAQLQNLSIPNTAMVVAIENAKDDPKNIHPKNKQDVGAWLALTARAKAYGEKIVYSGPLYSHYRIEGMAIRLYFDNPGSTLQAKDGNLTGFAICGKEGIWEWAFGKIEANTVLLWHPAVDEPVAARYCWGTNPQASLHNKEGLWTPNFRTDLEMKNEK